MHQFDKDILFGYSFGSNLYRMDREEFVHTIRDQGLD